MTENVYYKICVHGAVNLVLYGLRIFCVAPLIFAPSGIRVSPLLSLLGRVIITLISIFIIIDKYNYLNASSTIYNYFSYFFMILCPGGMVILSIIVAFTAVPRIHVYLNSLQQLCGLEKMITNSDEIRDTSQKKKMEITLIGFIVICTCSQLIFYIFYLIPGLQNADLIGAFKHVANTTIISFVYMMPIFLVSQMALLSLWMLVLLQKVNAHFRILVERNIKADTESYNLHFEIHRFAHVYLYIADIIRKTIEKEEIILIILLFNFYGHLEWPLHEMFLTDFKFNILDIFNFASHVQSTAAILACFILLIEPCHRVHQEMDVTNQLVYKLMQRSHLSKKVNDELEMFRHVIALNKPTFSPLGVCTLARPLFVKMIGVLVSHLIIILQFP